MDEDGRGWGNPAEAEREREREDRGNSWDEQTGGGGGKRGMPAFLLKLPGEANTNKQHRTAQGGSEGGRRWRGADPGKTEKRVEGMGIYGYEGKKI